MRSRGRRHPAALSVTADLFTQRPAETARPSSVRRVEPLPPTRALPSPQQLWHAVVFPELTEPLPHPASAVLQRLCLSAQQFTSLVSIEMPNALLLEIKGSVQLFGSLAALLAAIEAAWGRLSLRVQSASAPTPLAALWLARAGKPACIEECGLLASGLAEVPVACTGWEPEWLQTLQAMGVTRIGELLRCRAPAWRGD